MHAVLAAQRSCAGWIPAPRYSLLEIAFPVVSVFRCTQHSATMRGAETSIAHRNSIAMSICPHKLPLKHDTPGVEVASRGGISHPSSRPLFAPWFFRFFSQKAQGTCVDGKVRHAAVVVHIPLLCRSYSTNPNLSFFDFGLGVILSAPRGSFVLVPAATSVSIRLPPDVDGNHSIPERKTHPWSFCLTISPSLPFCLPCTIPHQRRRPKLRRGKGGKKKTYRGTALDY